MSTPWPWLTFAAESVGALGSAGAAIVALCLANRERDARKRAEAETSALLRAQRRAEAAQVVVQVRPVRPPQISGGNQVVQRPRTIRVASWRVEVHNTGSAPIRHVAITLWPHDEPEVIDSFHVADVVSPGETVVAASPRREEIFGAIAVFRLTFLDAHAEQWQLTPDGVPRETDTP